MTTGVIGYRPSRAFSEEIKHLKIQAAETLCAPQCELGATRMSFYRPRAKSAAGEEENDTELHSNSMEINGRGTGLFVTLKAAPCTRDIGINSKTTALACPSEIVRPITLAIFYS